MKIEDFPKDVRSFLIPKVSGHIVYQCLECSKEYSIDQLLYSCPDCDGILMLPDKDFDRLKKISGKQWRKIFDYRKILNVPGLKGIFLFYEFVAPVIPLDRVVYLGEGHTPLIRANKFLRKYAGIDFYFKNDGQNPSASFKDRGLACAISYINHLVISKRLENIITICASSGDTSASAALYSSYLHGSISSAVILPHKKVTRQQLSQPLSSGAKVFEIPGVFDDCMKVIEYLADHYNVALLNSKNAWRLRGQETFSYEIAQWFEYDMKNRAVVIPIGNAGNITAVLLGFLHFLDAGIIETLPKIVGVQTNHADPVHKYYNEPDKEKRFFSPVKVKPSVAQAAMIGNPVSMPRVISVVEEYNNKAGMEKVFIVSVPEQEIIDHQIIANRNGNIACTQGGMSLAGLKKALIDGIISSKETVILDSTAHELKFSDFGDLYNEDNFPAEFEISPHDELRNKPQFIRTGQSKKKSPADVLPQGLNETSVQRTAEKIAKVLGLEIK